MHMAIPSAIFIAYAMILLFQDLRTGVPEWIGLSGLIVVLLALGAWSAADWSMGFIVALGTIFRGMFLVRPPELSDDIYRYLFDGQMLLSGNNPYTTAPLNTIATHPAFSNLAALVNHGDLPTIYPPAAQFVFAAGAAVGGVFGMKLVLVVLDILMCVLIGQLLKRLGRPRSCLILYAWHPLPILEIAGSGHVDGAGILFLMAALVVLSIDFSKNQKPHQTPHRLLHETLHHLSGWGIGCFLAAAMLTKWLPIIFFPGVLMLAAAAQFHRPARLKQIAGGFLLSTVVMTGVFWPDLQNGFHTLFVYAANWEFSGFAFRTLRDGLASGRAARLTVAGSFIVIAGVIYFRCYQTMGIGRKETSAIKKNQQMLPFHSFYAVSLAFLLLTPTLHPWYALYLAAFLPFSAGPAGLVLSWSVLLGYRVVIGYALTGQWVESDLMPILIVAGPAATAIAAALLNQRRFRITIFRKHSQAIRL